MQVSWQAQQVVDLEEVQLSAGSAASALMHLMLRASHCVGDKLCRNGQGNEKMLVQHIRCIHGIFPRHQCSTERQRRSLGKCKGQNQGQVSTRRLHGLRYCCGNIISF